MVRRFDVTTCMMQKDEGKYVDHKDYEDLLKKYEDLKKTINPEPYLLTKNLDISTAHVKESDTQLLKQESCPLTNYDFQYGNFIHVPCDTSLEMYEEDGDDNQKLHPLILYGFSVEFLNILKLAKERGCKFIQLDCDGEEYADLPKFNW